MSDELNPVTGVAVRKKNYRDPMRGLDDTAFVPPPARPETVVKAEAEAPRARKAKPTAKQDNGASLVPRLVPAEAKNKKKSTFVWDADTLAAAEEWLKAHPGHTITSMIYCGMKAVGVDVADHLLFPVRQRGGKKKNK